MMILQSQENPFSHGLTLKNKNNDNKCIIYKSPVFVHRIYTDKHYSTFI